MEKLVIDRQEWNRHPSGGFLDEFRSSLKLKGKEQYCCLGLCCRDIYGCKPEELEKKPVPWNRALGWNPMGIPRDDARVKIIYRLMMVNDRESGPNDWTGFMLADWSNVTDEIQEELIRIGFRELNVEVEFVN